MSIALRRKLRKLNISRAESGRQRDSLCVAWCRNRFPIVCPIFLSMDWKIPIRWPMLMRIDTQTASRLWHCQVCAAITKWGNRAESSRARAQIKLAGIPLARKWLHHLESDGVDAWTCDQVLPLNRRPNPTDKFRQRTHNRNGITRSKPHINLLHSLLNAGEWRESHTESQHTAVPILCAYASPNEFSSMFDTRAHCVTAFCIHLWVLASQ